MEQLHKRSVEATMTVLEKEPEKPEENLSEVYCSSDPPVETPTIRSIDDFEINLCVQYLVNVGEKLQSGKYDHLFAADEFYLQFHRDKNNKDPRSFVTVMLSARLGKAKKCIPFVILPKGTESEVAKQKFESRLNSMSCEGSHFNEEATKSFLEKTITNSRKRKTVLVWDSYCQHMSDGVIQALEEQSIETIVMPHEISNYVHPMRVYWKKTFSNKMQELFNNWLKSNPNDVPPPEEYMEWILEAWGLVSRKEIAKSFVRCGLKNAPGGKDDHKIKCLQTKIPAGLELMKMARWMRVAVMGVSDSAQLGGSSMSEPTDPSQLKNDPDSSTSQESKSRKRKISEGNCGKMPKKVCDMASKDGNSV